MARKIARLLAVLLVVVAAMTALPRSAPAASNGGVVQGKINSGTDKKTPLAGAEVKLYWAKGQQEQPERTVRTDANGVFRFKGLPVGKDYVYVVGSRHAEVWYNTGRIGLTEKVPTQNVTLDVYEAGPDDSKVRVRSASVMFVQVDKVTQNISVLETFMFDNPTSTTFLPTTEGPKGPMGLLRFSIPSDASQLRPLGELSGRQVIQNDRGFATDLPIRPGKNEVTFTYQIPYRQPDGTYSFDMTMPYPTSEFRLLSPKTGPRVSSPQLKPGPPDSLWGDSYQVLTTGKLPARAKMSVAISQLPVNKFALSPDNRWLWAATGTLLALLLAIALLLWRRASSQAPATARTIPSAGERDTLVRAIARLDDEHRAGALDKQSYTRERELTKQRLLRLMASTP